MSNTISPESEKGKVTLYLNGVDTGINNFNANSDLIYKVSSVGTLRFSASYTQNAKNLETSEDVILYVNPMKTSLDINLDKHIILIGESINITTIVNSNDGELSSGIISYYIGEDLIGEVNVGEKFTFKGVNTGRYNLTALYTGDSVYATSTAVTYIIVNNETSNITDDIVIVINETNETVIVNETVIENITNETNDTIENTSIKVLKTILSGFKVGKTYILSLTDENGDPVSDRTITFAVNTNTVNLQSDENGQAEYSLEGFDDGDYVINAIFQGDTYYNSSKFSSKIVLESSDKSVLVIPNYRGSYREGGNLTGILFDANGNTIPGQHVELVLTRVSSGASKVYDVVSDFAGEFSLPINLASGLYSISAKYNGLDAYGFKYTESNSVKSSVIVTEDEDTRQSVIISTELYNNTYPGDGERNKDFVGLCTDDNGDALIGYTLNLRLIRLKADGSYGASKTYNTVVDYKGEYSLSIYLAPGNYKVISSFAGNDVYAQGLSSEDLIITRD